MTIAAIRPGSAAEIDAVMGVMGRAFDPAFGEAWSRAQCLGMLALADSWLLLACEDGRAVGFALGRLIVDDVELLLLAVEPAARGEGVGRELIERMAAQARAKGAGRLLLEMRADNPAQRLYEAAGFIAIGKRKDYYRRPDGMLSDAVTLARPIG